MEFLNNLVQSNDFPVVTAFVLGLLTALLPCTLATNITAVGYISKDIENRKRVFLNGMMYTLGRTLSYSVLGAIMIYTIRRGADTFNIQHSLSTWGERLLPVVLILIGLLLIFGHKIHVHNLGLSPSSKMGKLRGTYGGLVLGILLALAFCPTSGIFYFGMLIPMSAVEHGGYFLPLVFAVATAIPVIIVAWVLAFSFQRIGKLYGKFVNIQRKLNVTVGILFIAVGIFSAIEMYLE